MSLFKTALVAGLVAASIGSAHANIYNNIYGVTVTEGVTNGTQFSSQQGTSFSGANTATASFTYSGILGADNTATQNNPPPAPLGDLNSTFGFSTTNVTGYSGSGTVTYNSTTVANYNTLANFLSSSGSASGFAYGSTYAIDLGPLAVGTILTITHDDGVSVFQNGVAVGTTTRGPTTRRTEQVTVTTAPTGDAFLYYGRQNGTPSTLIVSVPEPMSIALLGSGLLGLGLIRRRANRG